MNYAHYTLPHIVLGTVNSNKLETYAGLFEFLELAFLLKLS